MVDVDLVWEKNTADWLAEKPVEWSACLHHDVVFLLFVLICFGTCLQHYWLAGWEKHYWLFFFVCLYVLAHVSFVSPFHNPLYLAELRVPVYHSLSVMFTSQCRLSPFHIELQHGQFCSCYLAFLPVLFSCSYLLGNFVSLVWFRCVYFLFTHSSSCITKSTCALSPFIVEP